MVPGAKTGIKKVLVMLQVSSKRVGRVLCVLTLFLGLALATLSAPGESLAAPSESELDAARDRLMELEADGEIIVERYNAAHDRLISLQAEIANAESAIDDLERRMASRENDAIAVAVELYKGGSTDALEAVLSSRSVSDIERRVEYLQSSQSANSVVFEQLAADRRRLEQEIADLEVKRSEAADAQAELTDLQNEVEDKIASQREEIEHLNALIEAAERRAARAAAERREVAEEAAAPPPSPSGGGSPSVQTPTAAASNPRAQAAVDAALSQVGKPYQWGAAGPDSYDCSGLTMWSWAHAGVSLPHNSSAQYAGTPRVSQSDWQPGDLLFFGSPIHHVGMYIGGGSMVEAPYSGTQVRVVSAYRSDYVGAGRPGV